MAAVTKLQRFGMCFQMYIHYSLKLYYCHVNVKERNQIVTKSSVSIVYAHANVQKMKCYAEYRSVEGSWEYAYFMVISIIEVIDCCV